MRPIHALAFVLAAAPLSVAFAHGGQFGHASSGPHQAPSMPCDCGKADCLACSAPGLSTGAGLSKRETHVEIVHTWLELAEVRATTVFATAEERTLEEHTFLEAFARIEQPTVFAVTGGKVTCVEHDLHAVRSPERVARRDYLWERDRRLRDPMLVLRDGPGAVSMRVFPISVKGPTTATLEGFVLLPRHALAPSGPHLYRTDRHFLVVLARTPETAKDADFVDEAGDRVLVFLSEAACRARYGARADKAVEVPCVPALRDAVLGGGDEAVCDSTALVALPPGSQAPANLFIGLPKDAPWIDPSRPPSLAPRPDPKDPTPPPPPPPVATAGESRVATASPTR